MDENDLPTDGATAPPPPAGPAPAQPAGPAPDAARRPRLLLAVVAVVALVAAGGAWAVARGDDGGTDVVAGGAGGPSGGEGGSSPWGRRWTLRSVAGDGAPELPETGSRGPLVLDLSVEGQVSFTACNGGSGTGRIEDRELVLDDGMISTAMACEEKLLMAYEEWMRDLLSSRPSVDVTASTLVVSSPRGTATFGDPTTPPSTTTPAGDPDCAVSSSPTDGGSAAADPPVATEGCGTEEPRATDPGSVLPKVPGPTIVPGPDGGGTSGSPGAAGLWGYRWLITRATVDGTEQVLVESQQGDALHLDALDGNRVGFNGCNGGGGDARLEGDRLVVDGIVATRMACEDVDGRSLMAQDAWMTRLLEDAPTVTIAADTLTLVTETAELTAVRRPLPDDPDGPDS